MEISSRLIFFSIWLYLLLLGCRKGELPQPPTNNARSFFGHWENVNSHVEEYLRLVILHPEEGQVSIQIWDDCGRKLCEKSKQIIKESAIEKGKIQFEWSLPNTIVQQEISITETGKLELLTRKKYLDTALEAETVDYFAKEKLETLFQQIQIEEVLTAKLSRFKINGSSNSLNQLNPGTVLLYQTTEGHFGKMQIRGNAAVLTLRWHTWKEDGSFLAGEDYMATRPNGVYEMNQGVEVSSTEICSFDFLMEEPSVGQRWLSPQCGASFLVYHLGN